MDLLHDGTESPLLLQIAVVSMEHHNQIYTCRVNSSFGIDMDSITVTVMARRSSTAAVVGTVMALLIVAVIAIVGIVVIILAVRK